jgi:hypothetical protein
LSPNVETLIIKEHDFSMDAHLLWKYIKEKFSKITTIQDSGEADYLTKPVRPVGQTGQTGTAKSAAPKLQKRKWYRSNQNSTSQTSSLPSTSHGECLMAKGKKKKKPTKVESEEEKEEEEEVDDEYDFDFDKLSKKYMIKIKNLFEKVQEQELSLEQQE